MPRVADFLISQMREAGVRTLFGLPGGGGNLDLIEAAGRAGLPFVLTATETGSAIGAIAQAEITGAPGACITTLGPGAASVVNGIACAKLERAPLLVITDNQVTGAVFEHQRIDQQALLGSLVKWSGSLAPTEADRNILEAFAQLSDLPPGPVHLDCPADFEQARGRDDTDDFHVHTFNSLLARDPDTYRRLISASRKPLLIVGLGARRVEDADAIRALCESHNIPALVTYKAKGVVPDRHQWFAGIFTNGAIERPLIDQCDLLIAIGFDPVEILPRPWAYRQPIVSLAPWEMARDHVPFESQCIGDVAQGVGELGERLRRSDWSPVTAPSLPVPDASVLTPEHVVRSVASRFAGRARVTVDAGAHMFPATMLWPVSEPNEMLISNGLSTMGFALPAAIGAGVLDRHLTVVALTGDGGLLICMGELATIARERLKIITVVFNDSSLSLIEIKQQARGLPPAGVALGATDWSKIAAGFGIASWTAETVEELDAALETASSLDGPSLIDARIDRSGYASTLKTIRG